MTFLYMEIVFYQRCCALLEHLDHLIKLLDKSYELTIHSHINQSFYMEKKVELMELLSLCSQSPQRAHELQEHLAREVSFLFERLAYDMRLLKELQRPFVKDDPD
jgi:hypothetical protein